MTQPDGTQNASLADDGWMTRERSLAVALSVATCVAGYLCYRLIFPFLPSLAWALALAVVAHPLHRWINRRVENSNLAAGLTVLVVAVLIVTPAIFVTQNLAREAARLTAVIDDSLKSGRWRSFLQNRRLKPVEKWMETQFNLAPAAHGDSDDPTEPMQAAPSNKSELAAAPVKRVADNLADGVGTVLTGVAWLAMQFFVTFMTLFFFFRDRQRVLGMLRSLIPLSSSETNDVFARVDDTIHATIYGSVLVAIVQGSMGGLMFWLLGLPSPVLWGAIMALLAVVPVLGTFVIWAPAAAGLALRGDWTKALILTAWGAIAIGLIDNLLYPYLVGSRMRFHTLLIFFAIAGGLALFGPSGVILGPLLLAVTDALLDIWRRRTAWGGTVEKCET